MNPPPDLVALFAERIAAAVRAARRYLAAEPERGALLLAVPLDPEPPGWTVPGDGPNGARAPTPDPMPLRTSRQGSGFVSSFSEGATFADLDKRGRMRMPPRLSAWVADGCLSGVTYTAALDLAEELARWHAVRLAAELTGGLDIVAEELRGAPELDAAGLAERWPLEGNEHATVRLNEDKERVLNEDEERALWTVRAAVQLAELEGGAEWGAVAIGSARTVSEVESRALWAWLLTLPAHPWSHGIAGRTIDAAALLWRAEHAARIRVSPLAAYVEARRRVRELAGPDPGPAYLAAVRDALGSYARSVEDPDALAAAALEDTPTARRRLLAFTSDLLDAARKVAPLFAVDPADDAAARETAETSHGPALRWDVAFAAVLTARGDLVRELAAGRWAAVYGPQVPIPDTPRPAPGSLWALWAARDDGPPRWLLWLAADLWVSVWRPAAERERAKPPAVWGPLFELLDRVHRPGGRIVEGVLIDRNGARVLDVRRDEPLPVALVHLEALGMLVRDGAGMLGSLNAHRFTRWAVPTAHTRALNGEPDARVLRADGGWTGLAELVGARSKKAPGELRAIVSALAHLWFPLPDGRGGNLLTYTESAAAGNWRSCVDITLGTALLPHYVNGIPRGTDRDLVPLPPLPPFVGRANEHGAQAAMQLGTMAHLRTRAAELVRHGGVLVTPDQWAELAKTHGLPADMLAAVLDRWTHNGDDGPAFLEALGGGRYRIADAHAAVQAFLLEAGRMEVNGAALAKQSSASKRKRLSLDR